jgi:hypothetical protein
MEGKIPYILSTTKMSCSFQRKSLAMCHKQDCTMQGFKLEVGHTKSKWYFSDEGLLPRIAFLPFLLLQLYPSKPNSSITSMESSQIQPTAR